jgi:signal transduction histidine kinase/CheY-like chemotaxis protein
MTPLWIELLHPDDRDRVLREAERAMAERRQIESEYRLVARDGSIHWVFDCGRFLYDSQGRPWARQGFSVDITEKRSLEEQLRQSQKMDAIGQLAGGIAHDFNNLLTAIQGYAGFIASSFASDDERRDDVKEILDATHRAAALTRQLLTFSRRQPLAPQVLRLGEVVSGLASMLRRVLGESIELQVGDHDRSFVNADAAQVEQVLMNLCINARDAMPDGGRLSIETADVAGQPGEGKAHPLIGAGGHVRLTVVDTGHGMESTVQARIFEPFFTTKPTGQGTGLGLATVYAIVKQSGGQIDVQSRIGEGTRFDVYLPQTDEPARSEPPLSLDEGEYRATEAILLVEDDPAVREFVHRVLTRQGYIVHDMSEPARAIEFSRAHRAPIELIVSDVVLPEMSGPEMARHIQRFHPEARVLFVSGFTANQIGQRDAERRFLQKPFSGDLLLRRVRAALEDPRTP